MKIPLFVLYKTENKHRKDYMSYQQLDLIFPYFVFGYGVLICFVTTVLFSRPTLMAKAQGRIPESALTQLRTHEPLGWICFIVGGLWSLQNLWIA